MMGGLRKKMPVTAYTMLIGCLAIAGAGVPTVIGLSGFHSKDYIITQCLSFWDANPRLGGVFFYAALAGAGMTAFYMFRLWYLTFAGNPRDGYVHHHAHESPRVDDRAADGFGHPGGDRGAGTCLGRFRPGSALAAGPAGGNRRGHRRRRALAGREMPAEHPHVHEIGFKAEWAAFGVAMVGFLLATAFYGLRKLNPEDARRTFPRIYWLLLHKWWFDELYAWLFVRPVLRISGWVAAVDKKGIDWLADNSARAVEAVARFDDWIDRAVRGRPGGLDRAADVRAGSATADDSNRQHSSVCPMDRRGHGGAVRVDEFVLEFSDCRSVRSSVGWDKRKQNQLKNAFKQDGGTRADLSHPTSP